jgi:hypothetical protein
VHSTSCHKRLAEPHLVCCSTRTLGELDERFQFKSNKSRLVKEDAAERNPVDGIEDSQFEGMLTAHFLVPSCLLRSSCCIAVHTSGVMAVITDWSHTIRHVPQAWYCDPLCAGITHLRDTDTLLVVKEEAEHGGTLLVWVSSSATAL